MPADQTDREDTRTSGRSISVTEVRRNLTAAIRRVREGEHVHVTRKGHPTAVLISVPEYERLLGLSREGVPDLEAQFDHMVAEMQMPAHRRGVDRLFRMSGRELGEAARRAAASHS